MRRYQDQVALEDDDFRKFREELGDAAEAFDRHTVADQSAVACQLHDAAIGEPCGSYSLFDKPAPFCCLTRRIAAAQAEVEALIAQPAGRA